MAGGGKSEWKDLVLPFAVVAVVGMMIFPLPPAVLDSLLMCNVAFALCLLISSVYLAQPGTFTTLPTILLLATLFRLGLNISTTRQLLGQGIAPEIVGAFGNFVVSGNIVVGVVVFAIITLVQFLVIAKGAERIAEVAARFTLDAMPGKQMSIDADVRAGIIGLYEAKDKRLELQRESKLYGALDGAMKFVKGDAIAGLIITVINITAGLVVGVSQQGLSFSAAAEKYTIFTIGDGLVSQIPALLVAVAAGIAVTRVENKDSTFVGRDVFTQLSREPQALGTTGFVLFLLALVPGLPTLPFIVAAAGFAVAASLGAAQRNRNEQNANEAEFRPKIFSTLALRMSAEATALLQKEAALPKHIKELRNKFFERWGIVVPDVQFDVDPLLVGCQTKVYLFGVHSDTVRWGTSTEDQNSKETYSERLRNDLDSLLAEHLANLVDDTQTRILLEVHQPVAEDLINNVVPEIISVTALTTILRQLIVEQVSIRELRTILQAIAEFHLLTEEGPLAHSLPVKRENGVLSQLKALGPGTGQTEMRELLAEVREKLARTISRNITDDEWQLHGWTLAPRLDHLLARISFAQTPLDPSLVEQVLRAVSNVESEERLVILTTKYARSVLAELLATQALDVQVVGINELVREVQLHLDGEIQLEVAEPQQREEHQDNVAVLRQSIA